MQVFIMRHGEVVQAVSSGAVRPLTLYGRNQSQLRAVRLNNNYRDIKRALVGPYFRVTQT